MAWACGTAFALIHEPRRQSGAHTPRSVPTCQKSIFNSLQRYKKAGCFHSLPIRISSFRQKGMEAGRSSSTESRQRTCSYRACPRGKIGPMAGGRSRHSQLPPPCASLPSSARQANPQEMAPVGHTDLHFPQRIHSGLLIFFVTSTFIGHERSHFPHSTHLPPSRRI